MNKWTAVLLILLIAVSSAFAQRELGVRPTETGGPLMAEQAVYDVQTYDVALKVDPKAKTISGTTVMTAKVVKPTDVIVLDLDTPYTVERVFGQTGDRQAGLKYERRGGKIWIWFGVKKQPGDVFETLITYSG